MEILPDDITEYLPQSGEMRYSFVLKRKESGHVRHVRSDGFFKSSEFSMHVYAWAASPSGNVIAIALQNGIVHVVYRMAPDAELNSHWDTLCTGLYFPAGVFINDKATIIGVWSDCNLHIWAKGYDNLWYKERVNGSRLYGSDTVMSDGYYYFEHKEHGEIAVMDSTGKERYRWKRHRSFFRFYWNRMEVTDH
ncbi:MAG TPA: hypothetical protein VHA78_02535 [Candidatus Peribacteraceae bacterium]|nr:hypothetical protein [Candidatus Peribacteraceae bacterium]